jgi:hypothetical protein
MNEMKMKMNINELVFGMIIYNRMINVIIILQFELEILSCDVILEFYIYYYWKKNQLYLIN